MRLNQFILSIFLLIIVPICSNAQSAFSTFGTRTLFEAQDNPSIGTLSNCKTFEANMLMPSLYTNTLLFGPADTLLRNALINNSKTIYNMTPLANPQALNYVEENSVVRWVSAKILLDIYTGSELLVDISTHVIGFGTLKNEAISFSNPDNISGGTHTGTYVTNSYAMTYTQMALGYRREINKHLALGGKAGYVSGIYYTGLNITNNILTVEQIEDTEEIGVTYSMRGSYKNLGLSDETHIRNYLPNGFNPGFTFSFGASGQIDERWSYSAYIKDIGAIWWRNNNKVNNYDGSNYVENEPLNSFDSEQIADLITTTGPQYHTDDVYKTSLPTTFGGGVSAIITDYLKGSFALSAPLTRHQSQTQFVWIADLFYKNNHVRLQPQVNTKSGFQFGVNYMLKARNLDFIMGTDDIYGLVQGIRMGTRNPYYYDSKTVINFNFGMVFNFGNCYYSQNTSYIPVGGDGGYDSVMKRKVKRTNGY
jgi:hypothetical protein